MNYGPNAKQLGKLAKLIFGKIPKETIDIQGYYADGLNDAGHGRAFNIGSLKLQENISAYETGYFVGTD